MRDPVDPGEPERVLDAPRELGATRSMAEAMLSASGERSISDVLRFLPHRSSLGAGMSGHARQSFRGLERPGTGSPTLVYERQSSHLAESCKRNAALPAALPQSSAASGRHFRPCSDVVRRPECWGFPCSQRSTGRSSLGSRFPRYGDHLRAPSGNGWSRGTLAS